MKINTDGSVNLFSDQPRTDFHLASSVMKVGWHICPEALVHGMVSFLHAH